MYTFEQDFRTQRPGPRGARSRAYRCFVLLLILALSTPAMVHAGQGGHADVAAQPDDAEAMQHDAGGGHDDHAHEVDCNGSIACSPCVPASVSDAAPLPRPGAIGTALPAPHARIGPYLLFRPPRLS